MKGIIICFLIVCCIAPVKSTAQTIEQGLFMKKERMKYDWNLILELKQNKFYAYFIPAGISTILIETGSFEVNDSLLTLKVDTAIDFSLNINRIGWMRIGCKPPYVMHLNSEDQVIRLEYNTFLDNTFVELEPADDIKVANAMKRFGGLSILTMKSYLRENFGDKIKRCSD